MASLPWTPIMVSAVRNGIPLPDWDGDLEQWAVNGHVQSEDEAVAEGVALVRAAMERYDAETRISAYTVANRHTDYSVYYLCVSQDEVDAIFREFDPRGYGTDEILTDRQIEKWRNTEGIPDGVRIVRRSRSSD